MIAINQMETHIGKREVIEYLETEAKVLREKLLGVEQAMATLKRLFDPANPTDLSSDEFEQTATFNQHTDNVVSLRKSHRNEIPTVYDKNGSYGKKILFILNKEDEMSTTQLVDYILTEEPELEEKLVKLNVGKAATRLLDDGKVSVEKSGNQNFYRLK